MADLKTTALIKKFEGYVGKPYRDPVGIWTVGWGHKFETITKAEAEAWLDADIAIVDAEIDAHVKVPLTANQRGALTSFIFNVGIGAFAGSTLLKRLNSGQYGAVPHELMQWVHAGGRTLPGLVARRKAEAALWSS